MLKLKNKKGIETKMLIGLLLLLIGFGIVLMFYYRINFPPVVDKQVCAESVNLRGIASGVAGTTGESFVALKCKTKKVCITSGLIGGGGTCEENFGKESVVKAKVTNSALGANQSAKVISDEVLSCWNMMGQGRLSLFSSGWKSQFGLDPGIYSSCVICSRIAFDIKNTNNFENSNINVYDYMIRHKVPGKDFTYASYIAEGSPAGISITDTASVLGSKTFNSDVLPQFTSATLAQDQSLPPMPVTKSPEIAVIFMQFASPDYKSVILNTFGIVGASFVLPGIGTYTRKAAGLIFSNPYTGIPAAIGIATFAGYQAWNVYKGYDAAIGYCGDITIGGSSGNYGCSAIRVIPYDAENIKHFCGAIESIP
jgi:hypothetical protein